MEMKVTKNVGGQYVCIASNEEGNISDSIQVQGMFDCVTLRLFSLLCVVYVSLGTARSCCTGNTLPNGKVESV